MKLTFFVLSILFSFSAWAQEDTLRLQDFTVTANIVQTELKNTARNVTIIDRKTIDASPVKTLDAVLQYAMNVDVRSRSSFGVQADISIRGGHYDQTLILVDGVKVNDPQTGHHSLNIPVPFSMIKKIEVLSGGASRVFGPSAFSGVINIITKKPTETSAELLASAGSYGTWQLGANTAWVNKGFTVTAAYDQARSDGYIPSTDFKKSTGSVKLDKTYKQGNVNLGYGYMSNDMGLTNAYHPKFFNQYEEVSADLLTAAWKHAFSPKLSSTLLANYRIHYDMYDFDNYRKNDKLANLNFHRTNVFDIEWKFKSNNRFGQSAFGLEYRNEAVKSNRLGEDLGEKIEVKNWENQFYTKGKTRDNYSVFVEHSKTWNKLNISVGTLGNYNSQFGFALYPGMDIGYAVNTNSKLYYSINRSLRFPTFTELYLTNNSVIADPNLKPEKALTNEIGFKTQKQRYSGNYAVFYTKTQDALDKIKRPGIDVPTMENIDNINLFGFETAHTIGFNKNKVTLKQIVVNFAWTAADRKEEGFQSFYTLNYLKQKASAGLFFEPLKNFTASGWYTFKNRAGQYSWDAATAPVDYGLFSLVDLRLAYQIQKFTLTLDANNLLNEKYFEHGFVAQPPRWISGGVRVNF
jgi:vitamin B12 transporter